MGWAFFLLLPSRVFSSHKHLLTRRKAMPPVSLCKVAPNPIRITQECLKPPLLSTSVSLFYAWCKPCSSCARRLLPGRFTLAIRVYFTKTSQRHQIVYPNEDIPLLSVAWYTCLFLSSLWLLTCSQRTPIFTLFNTRQRCRSSQGSCIPCTTRGTTNPALARWGVQSISRGPRCTRAPWQHVTFSILRWGCFVHLIFGSLSSLY